MLLDALAYIGTLNWPLLLALLVAAGLASGLLAGLLGIGGGIIVVPVLFYIFTAFDVDPAVRMHLAVGTSLAVIIPTAWRSVATHHKRGSVDIALARVWTVPLTLGIVGGALLAARLSTSVMTLVFAGYAVFNALLMVFGREQWHLSASLPKGPVGLVIPAAIGLVSAMTGLGGGALSVPALTLFNYPIHKAVGTSAGFGLVIGVVGALGFAVGGFGAPGLPPLPWAIGYISLPGLVLIAPATAIAAPWGARLAHRLSRTVLRRVFAAFLILLAAHLIIDIAA